MKLETQKFSLLIAAGSALLYAACAAFVALLPDLSAKLMGSLFHVSNPQTVFGATRVTLNGAIIGIIEVAIYTYVAALIFAWIFNKSVKT